MALTVRNSHTVTLPALPPQPVEEGSVSLDSTRVPYGVASIVLPLTVDTQLEPLDPRTNTRITLDASNEGQWDDGTPPVWVPSAVRTFNLGLRSRTVDHVAKTVTLETSTDEALLIDYMALTLDTGARAHQASARAVTNWVLGFIGAALAATPATDADLTAYWELTNMLPNPEVYGSIGTYYGAGPGASAVAYDGAQGAAGSGSSVRWTANGANEATLDVKQFTASEGTTYTASAYVRASVARAARLRFNWRDSEGVLIKATYGVALTARPDAFLTRITLTAKAPPGTARIGLWVEGTGTPPTGTLYWGDRFMLYVGAEVVAYFDGTSGDTTHYALTWENGSYASQSTRTPLEGFERDPDMYQWKPGVTAWDFIAPLLTTVNLRLFCDERRVWRLVNPSTYTVPGAVVISQANASHAADTITRDDPLLFATGVVARYTWVNSRGETVTKTDSAGTPSKGVVLDYAKPFPGRGAAAAILFRRDGSARAQDVEGLGQWAATPGQTGTIILPLAPVQNGKVIGASWSLGDDALMRLTTTGLIDIPAGSWLATPKTEKWVDPPESTWLAWT